MSSRALALLALIVVVMASSVARLAHLGESELWFDEFLHVFAARSLMEHGVPELPSGRPYARGLEITRLVAVAERHVADPELAARLPSAILGIANVLIFAAIAWRIAGPWAAVWAALLLGTYPGAVLEARNTRFYTEQLNLGLIAFWFGWQTVRSPPTLAASAPLATWGNIAGTLIALAAAARVQLTTGSVAAGWAMALAGAAMIDLRVLGREAWRRSARLQAVVIGAIGVLLVLVARPSLVRNAMQLAVFVPAWAEGQYSPKTYYWMMAEWMPLLLALLPVIFLMVGRFGARLAGYLALWFGVPLALHSFVFRFQADRYVLLAMPGLLLAAAVAATSACAIGYRALVRLIERRGIRSGLAAPLAAAVVLGCALFTVATRPAFTLTRKQAVGAEGRTDTDWRLAAERMARIPGSDSIPWGTANPLAALFYWPRVDFAVYDGEVDTVKSVVAGGDTTITLRDAYAAMPVVIDPAALRSRFGRRGAVLIAVDSAYYTEKWDRPVFRALRQEAVEVCERHCGAMRVYYWPLSDSLGTERPVPLGADGPRPP